MGVREIKTSINMYEVGNMLSKLNYLLSILAETYEIRSLSETLSAHDQTILLNYSSSVQTYSASS